MRQAVLVLVIWVGACAPGQAQEASCGSGKSAATAAILLPAWVGWWDRISRIFGSAPLREPGRWASTQAYIEESIRVYLMTLR
jgi:hypothetical protein